MTHYVMTLYDSVDLGLDFFKQGKNGDLFVQKAPAATLEVLAKAVIDMYKATTQVRLIGIR